MSKKEILEILAGRKEELRRFGVRRIGLFGSYVRGTQRRGSDIDFLVDFKEKSFDNYMGLKLYLEKLLRVKVDLVISESIKPRLKPLIMKEVEYAQGF